MLISALLIFLLLSAFPALSSWFIKGIYNQSTSNVCVEFINTTENDFYESLLETGTTNGIIRKITILPLSTITFTKEIKFPTSPHTFIAIKDNELITEYLKIQTKKAVFYCVQGTFLYKNNTLFGCWAQRILPIKNHKEDYPVISILGQYGENNSYFIMIDKNGFIQISSQEKLILSNRNEEIEKNLNKTI